MRRYGASFAGASAIEERADRIDDRRELRLRDAGEDRERQAFPRKCLRYGKITGAMTQPCVRLGEMNGFRIVPPSGDAATMEEGCEALRLRRAHDIEVPHRRAARRHRWKPEVADALENIVVEACSPAPLPVPSVQKRELVQEDECLNRVETGCPALE